MREMRQICLNKAVTWSLIGIFLLGGIPYASAQTTAETLQQLNDLGIVLDPDSQQALDQAEAQEQAQAAARAAAARQGGAATGSQQTQQVDRSKKSSGDGVAEAAVVVAGVGAAILVIGYLINKFIMVGEEAKLDRKTPEYLAEKKINDRMSLTLDHSLISSLQNQAWDAEDIEAKDLANVSMGFRYQF